MSISEARQVVREFKRSEAARLGRGSQQDLTTGYKYAPDSLERKRLYGLAAQKAGPTTADKLAKRDWRGALELAQQILK